MGASLMFLIQMMDLVTKMRDHLNSNTFKAEYFNQVKGKTKRFQSLYLSFIVMEFVMSQRKVMEQQPAFVHQT